MRLMPLCGCLGAVQPIAFDLTGAYGFIHDKKRISTGAGRTGCRVVGRVIRPRPCRPCPYHEGGAEAVRAGQGVVDGQPCKSVEGTGACADRGAPLHGPQTDAASLGQRDRYRGPIGHGLYGGNDCSLAADLSQGAVRVVDGGGQPDPIPPLAGLARNCRAGADRGAGTAGRPDFSAHIEDRQGLWRPPVARPRGGFAGAGACACVVVREFADDGYVFHKDPPVGQLG